MKKKGWVCRGCAATGWEVCEPTKDDWKSSERRVFEIREHAEITAKVLTEFWAAPGGKDIIQSKRLKIWATMMKIMLERGIQV